MKTEVIRMGTIKKRAAQPSIHNNESVRAKAERQRVNKPISLKGISEGELIKITPKDYKRIDIDPGYQRGEIKGEINSLIAAIQAGGFIPDPVTLVQREWETGDAAKTLWVIDGQQRIAAFSKLNEPFQAMVHRAADYTAEKNFFLVMNTRQAVHATVFVHSWPGPSADMMRSVCNLPDHPLHNRIHWQAGGPNQKISAAILAKGLLAAANGGADAGIQSILSRTDHALRNDPSAKERARAFLHLAGHVFGHTYAPSLAVQALGMVAYRRWSRSGTCTLPTAKRMKSIAAIKWDIAPSSANRYRGLLELEIEKRWSTQELAG